ncbi:MAG TPA: multiheme c-type cytochrome [Verrucomicrobiales bacterium]|nr:multiheme c-type cytochrome [Verrucomicrobiales bacterium]
MRRFLLALVLAAGGLAAGWHFLKHRSATAEAAGLPLDIWFTCETNGRIEPCGCFSGQYGGLTRVSTVLASVPRPGLKLEIGNAIAGGEDYHILQFRYLLEAQGRLGYAALNLGSREASLSAESLRSLAKDSPVPLISANVLDAATRRPVVEPWRVVETGGLRVGVIGVVHSSRTEPHKSVHIEDAFEALRRVIPAVKEGSDLLVCMAFTDESGLAGIARAFYELPIILGGDVRQPSQSLERVNQSWILATTNESRALGELHTSWNPRTKSLGPVTGEITLMRDSIPEDPVIAAFSSDYRREVRSTKLDIDRPRTDQDLIPGVEPSASYLGSEACAGCHPSAYASWSKTQHAHAFDSLVRKDSDADPSCIACHVVGFGEPGGYQRSLKGERLVHVGCESCHGPGSEHVTARVSVAPGEEVFQKMRPVGPGFCVQCHHGEFSRPFRYDAFWPLIEHGKEVKAGGD